MKKENYYKFMCVISALLVVSFVLVLVLDYFKYDPMSTSAPFYINILVRTLEFILPSIIVFVAGIIFKKKFSK